jgi:hypothetical protein
MAASLNMPGSWHDSHVAHPIYDMLRHKVPHGYFLVADSAFLQGMGSVKDKI